MKLFVSLFVIGLLEQDIGADLVLGKLSVILDRCCGDIYIYTTNSTVFVLNAVNGIDAFKNVIDGVVYRILAALKCKALMAHILERDYFLADFLLCKLFSWDSCVFCMVRTI